MKKRVLLILTVIVVGVIFFHSSMSAADSTVESDSVFGLFDKIVEVLHMPNILTATSIRKVAHFVQFAVFGGLLTATVFAHCNNIKKELFKILFLLLAVPVIDEFIQCFSDGRSSLIKDVLLDFSGGIFGFVLLSVILILSRKTHSKT